MFKFKSYNIKKAEEKNEASSSKTTSSSSKTSNVPSYATGTLKKTTTSSSKTSSVSSYVSPKNKKIPSAREIKEANNYQPPEYSKKIYPKKTVSDWKKNDTYLDKNKTANVVIPSPKKKLERKYKQDKVKV